MSIISPQAPCGIFAPRDGEGTMQRITFVRSAAFIQHRMPQQNAAGEVLQSYAQTVTVTADVQPMPAGYTRMIQGIMNKVDVMMFVVGYADVREGDRCYLGGVQCEVQNALHYGSVQTEIELQHIGR